MERTNEQVIENWKNREIVHSIEMGGFGPSYEQALQVCVFEIFAALNGNGYAESDFKKFWEDANAVVDELDKTWGGFSGAQVGAAKQLAWAFITKGHATTIKEFDDDKKRQIMVMDNMIMKPR